MKKLGLTGLVAVAILANFAFAQKDFCNRMIEVSAKCAFEDGKYILYLIRSSTSKNGYKYRKVYNTIKERNRGLMVYRLLKPDPSYSMPGGKGSLDRIIGKNPKTGKVDPYYQDVSREKSDLINAKNAYKKASKNLERARHAYKKAESSKNKEVIAKAKEKLDDAIRDAELSKAKVKEKKEIFTNSKK